MNHYDWLDINFQNFVEGLGVEEDLRGLISAHGDKCYSYKDLWERMFIPFEHGVAVYLLTYWNPWSKDVRVLENGDWQAPETWVVDNYENFKKYLEEV